jgi:predicted RNA methylase
MSEGDAPTSSPLPPSPAAVAVANAAEPQAAADVAPPGGTETQTTESQFGTAYSKVQSQYGDPWQNDEYYHQYAKLTIHNEMLRDKSRTLSYMKAICETHKDEFKDKVVLDIGCGTGILSFFAARAGARVVYAVEASDLADYTEQVVAANGLTGKIMVVKGKLEEISFPIKVDIIISEWMGSFLIFESMLESVLWGRDHILKPGGNLFPGLASMHFAPVDMSKMYDEKIDFWKDVYDVDMSVLMPYAKKCAFEKPLIDVGVEGDQLLADGYVLKTMDLRTVPIGKPYEKTMVPFKFTISKKGRMQGFVAWFDTDFVPQGVPSVESAGDKSVTLSTHPKEVDTHWHQVLLLFDDFTEVAEGAEVSGTMRWQRNPELLRHLIIDITFQVNDERHSTGQRTWYLWGTE